MPLHFQKLIKIKYPNDIKILTKYSTVLRKFIPFEKTESIYFYILLYCLWWVANTDQYDSNARRRINIDVDAGYFEIILCEYRDKMNQMNQNEYTYLSDDFNFVKNA